MLKKGDACPCCGQPIKTKDEDLLFLLSWIAAHRRMPMGEEITEIHEEAKSNAE